MTSLEPDPYKMVLSDRTLETILDKIFPTLDQMDQKDEEKFYADNAILLKEEHRSNGSEHSKNVNSKDDYTTAPGTEEHSEAGMEESDEEVNTYPTNVPEPTQKPDKNPVRKKLNTHVHCIYYNSQQVEPC